QPRPRRLRSRRLRRLRRGGDAFPRAQDPRGGQPHPQGAFRELLAPAHAARILPHPRLRWLAGGARDQPRGDRGLPSPARATRLVGDPASDRKGGRGGGPAGVRGGGHRGPRRLLHRGHVRRLRLGRPGDLPRRRHHRGGDRRLQEGLDPRPLSPCSQRPPDPQRQGAGGEGRRADDPAERAHRRATGGGDPASPRAPRGARADGAHGGSFRSTGGGQGDRRRLRHPGDPRARAEGRLNVFRGRRPTIHFVGIGGIGMSGIAEVLLNLGYPVTGSDLRGGENTRRLESFGARIFVGHRPETVGDADVVVCSSAVRSDNPEVRHAKDLGIPVIPRAEMLAELMRLKYGIAVAGSHGKTTTTSLVAHLLAAGGLDPTAVVGGKINGFGSNAKLGKGEYMVVEADESDGSFLRFSPAIAVVTNIDPEHLEHYGDFEALQDAFLEFVNRVPFYGLSILCLDHPVVQALLPRVERRAVTYGFSAQADYRATAVEAGALEMRFSLVRRGEVFEGFRLPMAGRHNVQNALAAIAVADDVGMPMEAIREALAGFDGVQRRFTVRGHARG